MYKKQAYQEGLYGSKYAWIIVGSRSLQLSDISSACQCTQEELRLVLDGVLVTDILDLSTSAEVTIAGMVRRCHLISEAAAVIFRLM